MQIFHLSDKESAGDELTELGQLYQKWNTPPALKSGPVKLCNSNSYVLRWKTVAFCWGFFGEINICWSFLFLN